MQGCRIAECAVALMVACVPGVYGLWSHNIVPSGIYSRLSAALSHVFLARSKGSKIGASDGSIRSYHTRPSTASAKLVPAESTEHELRDFSREA